MKVRYQSILPDPDQWEQGIVGPDGSIMSRQLFEFFADAKKKSNHLDQEPILSYQNYALLRYYIHKLSCYKMVIFCKVL